MGIDLLSPLVKGIGSVRVSLRHGQGSHVVIDGRFLNHRMSARSTAARDLVIDDDLTSHVRQCARHIRLFEGLGYRVTVVFDGSVPPAKAAAASELARQREHARRRARDLDGRKVQPEAVNQVAVNACVFDARTVARIAALLRPKIKGKVFLAPGEAGPQLVVFQDAYRRNPQANIVFVYAEDPGLIVLGVRLLLWEVSETGGGDGALTGSCIHARAIFQPSPRDFAVDTDAHAFLRQLHGLPRRHDPALRARRPLGEATARARLTAYAAIVGNDYAAFENVDPAAAAKIALKPVKGPARDAAAPPFSLLVGGLARGLAELSREGATPRCIRRAEEKLRTCNNMFRHAVVWDPVAGVLRHFSGAATSGDIARDTGTLALSSMASRIAAGEVCATTGREWAPPLTETRQGQHARGAPSKQNNSQQRRPSGSSSPSPLPSHAKIPKRVPPDTGKNGLGAGGEGRGLKRGAGGGPSTPPSSHSLAKIPKRLPPEMNRVGFDAGRKGKHLSRGPGGPGSPPQSAPLARIPKRAPPDTTTKQAFSTGGQGNGQRRGSPAPAPSLPPPPYAKIAKRSPHGISGAERVSLKRGRPGTPDPFARPSDLRKAQQPETSAADDRPKNGINRLPYEGEDINAWIASRGGGGDAGGPAAQRRRSVASDDGGSVDWDKPASPWSSLGKTQRSATDDGKQDFVLWGQGGSRKRDPSQSLAPARSPDPRRKPQPETFVVEKYPRNGANRSSFGGEDITKWMDSRGAPAPPAPPVVKPSRCLSSGCGKIVERDVSFCSDDCMVAAQKLAARALVAVRHKQREAASSGRDKAGAPAAAAADAGPKKTGSSVPRKGKKSKGEPESRAPPAAGTSSAATTGASSTGSAERRKASATPPPAGVPADEDGFGKGLEAVRGARSEQGQKFRHKIMDIFRDLFSEGMAELGVDAAYAAAHGGVLAWDLEHELNAFFHANREGYREKAQSLRFNIKFAKNPELFKDLLAGITSMRTLCGMSIDDLASSHLREERKRIRDGSYAGHLRQDMDGSEIVYKDGALQRIAIIKSDAEKQVDVLPGLDFDIVKGERGGDAGNDVFGDDASSQSSSSR